MVDKAVTALDFPTLQHAIQKLEERLQAVVTYGSGGCPSCHDAELRGAIATLKRMAVPTDAVTATSSMRRR
jgi:hypothetical protein